MRRTSLFILLAERFVSLTDLSCDRRSDLLNCGSLPFQLATKVTTFFIEHFGMRDLFGRENYEYYARLTGRILKVGGRQ